MPLRLPRTTFLLLRVRPVWERRRRRARSSTCMCAAGRRVQDKDKISLIFRPLQDRVVPEIGAFCGWMRRLRNWSGWSSSTSTWSGRSRSGSRAERSPSHTVSRRPGSYMDPQPTENPGCYMFQVFQSNASPP